jgi:hypothetical protein
VPFNFSWVRRGRIERVCQKVGYSTIATHREIHCDVFDWNEGCVRVGHNRRPIRRSRHDDDKLGV